MRYDRIFALHVSTTVKQHFYVRGKFIRTHQNGPVDNLCDFYLRVLGVLCIVTYGMIKIYAVQSYATGAWLTYVIRINNINLSL